MTPAHVNSTAWATFLLAGLLVWALASTWATDKTNRYRLFAIWAPA